MRRCFLPQALIAPGIAAIAIAGLFALFAPTMPRLTHAGVKIRAWTLGFEEFVGHVETGRLEADEARHIFESLAGGSTRAQHTRAC